MAAGDGGGLGGLSELEELTSSDCAYEHLPASDLDQPRSTSVLLTTIQEDMCEGLGHNAPGRPLVLSLPVLKKLEPELSGVKGAWSLALARMCCFLPPSHRLQEHLIFGEPNPAVVISVSPLVVAAYAAPLDCVVLLSFKQAFLVKDHGLKIGSRLLAICTYKRGTGKIDSDLDPGPKAKVKPSSGLSSAGSSEIFALSPHTSAAESFSSSYLEYGNPLYETGETLGQAGSGQLAYSGVYPLIADFLTQDSHAVRMRKEQFQESDWRGVMRMGLNRLQSAPGAAPLM